MSSLQQYQKVVESNYISHQSVFSMDEYNDNNNNEETKLVYSMIKISSKSNTTSEK